MSIISFLVMLLIASITGSIGAGLAGRRNTGCLPSMALGFIGAVIGSALFVAVLNLFGKRE